ncbi:MAG: TOPRIM nucleotidyl transferase/hydrolase domain-containing protein [Bryobacteraceae bacterium]
MKLEELAIAYAKAIGKQPLSEPELRKRLHALDAPLREAFFTSALVLTEGVSDIGVLAAEAEKADIDLEALGIVAAPFDGKGQLPLAVTILSLLGIAHFAIFDSDGPQQAQDNRDLLSALRADPSDIPDSGVPETMVRANYAVLNRNLEFILARDFGEADYTECVRAAGLMYGSNIDKVMKNPVSAQAVIRLLHQRGKSSATLENIVKSISALTIVGRAGPGKLD